MRLYSNKKLIYDARSNKSAFIAVELNDWKYDAKNKIFTTTVQDYSISEDGVESIIFNKSYSKSAAEVDIFRKMINLSISIEDVFDEKLEILMAKFLIYVTIYEDSEPIYGSEFENWFIKNDDTGEIIELNLKL